ncbi:MAG TPA: amino acid adenylation domain-containing protein [Chitinophagaceae bacterium]|nr:amino acid adenylation domain-containing protein [Chitinophagaceae bacterium]
MTSYTGLEIAVIGMAGRFPGAADVRSFWSNLSKGVESVSFFSDEELLKEGEDPAVLNDPNYIKANAFVEGKEYFDAAFFNYRPDEARLMDPQSRMFHECVWEALEDAGCDLNDPANRIGLFAGSSANLNWEVYAHLLNREGLVDPFSASQLINGRFLATRISYLLNLRGPSVYIDTACSTSLVAVHQACRSLIVSDCNIALAGGVTLMNRSRKGYMHREGMIFSRDGHCRTFDAEASGTVGGEGAAVVVLKMLKNALKDGDHIWAIIKGSGSNNDGNNKVGYTAPSIDGQSEAIMMAHKWAKVEPSGISYVEAHGTATRLGDPIEVEALNRVFGKSDEKYCALGSVKSNIGHLDSAAGAAGLIKTVLALKHRQIPPSLHFNTPNPEIKFKDSPFYVNTELRDWKHSGQPLRAGVSSFGIGGTNAHVVLEEAPQLQSSSPGRAHQLLLLSARTPSALERNISNLACFLKEHPQENIADVAYTLQTGRAAFEYRKAFVCSDADEAIKLLTSSNAEDVPLPVDKIKSPVVFMFSGQGSQYVNMCNGLYQTEMVFRDELDNCLVMAGKCCDRDFRSALFGNTNLIDDTEFTQPVLFMIEYALARLLMSWGIQPAMMIGHSIGEYVAACISGVFSLEDALALVIKRGRLMQQVSRGSMISILIKEDELNNLLAEHPSVSIAAVNSSALWVVSGEDNAIRRFRIAVENDGYVCREVRTSHAFHSHMMDEILDEFETEVSRITIHPPAIPFISNLTGRQASYAEIAKPAYWRDHLRYTVQFAKGLDTVLQKKAVLIEVGPGKTLSTFVRSHQSFTHHHLVVNLVRHPRETVHDQHYLLNALGELWANGIEPSWKLFYKEEMRRKVSLPTYSFDKVMYPVHVDAFKILKGDLQPEAASNDEPATEIAKVQEVHPERALKLLWQDFFGRAEIGMDEDFFEIGGDSLKALTMIGRIHKKLNVEVSLSEFFRRPTIQGLSQYVQAVKRQDDAAIQKAPQVAYYPLSSAQKRVYFLHQFNRTSLAYNLPQVVQLQGELDQQKLEAIFQQLIQRHETLRTSFHIVEEEPVQKVWEQVTFSIERLEGSCIHSTIDSFIRPFDLQQAPLIRAGMLGIAPLEHVLMLDMHHIIADGVSQAILVKELVQLYNDQSLPQLNLQYKDYAVWQQSPAQQEKVEAQKAFWLQEFSEEVNAIELPADYPRPAVRKYEGSTKSFSLGEEQAAQLRSLAGEENVTLFMLLLSCYHIFLAKLSGHNDIVIGTPAAGRQHPDLEGMIGMFVNTLPLRNDARPEQSFREFLAAVKTKTLACFDNQGYQYEDLVDQLKLERNTSRNPLFDVLFSYQNIGEARLAMQGLSVKPFANEQTVSQFDLTLRATEAGNDILLKFEYATALFSPETIQRFADWFRNILSAVLADPDQQIGNIEFISEAEKNMLHAFNDTAAIYPQQQSIHSIFEEQVRCNGERTAISFGSHQLSYHALNKKANQLAAGILKTGIAKESIIGILVHRSPELLISILAVLKAGCAYLPIDPDYPADRISYVLQDSGLALVLTEPSLMHLCGSAASIDVTSGLDREADHNPGVEVPSSALAYLIYTSGSTGNPKGVMIAHSNVVNFLYGLTEKIPFNSTDTILCLTTVSFDIFVLETLVPLMRGMRIVLASSTEQKDPNALAALITGQGVNMLQLTPSHLKLLLSNHESGRILQQVRAIMIGGEALPLPLLTELQAQYTGRIYNMYGPTETTVWSAIADLTGAAVVTIGKPIANTTISVINKHKNLLPPGIAGELCIGGAGVAKGYRNRADLTNEKFIADPASPGERLYRTGDQARWLPDGTLEFLGRIDNQVKIRGFRIEPGEIEAKLRSFRAIHEAVVAVKEKDGDKFLVAYYTSAEDIPSTVLREHLAAGLPAYMLPAYYLRLSQWPLTPNGKLNRKALPDPGIAPANEYTPPSNETESQLVEIWSDILKVDKQLLSVKRSFFDMGGHSLKATVLVNKMNRQFNVDIPLQEIFNKQTIESLADYLTTIRQMKGEMEAAGDLIEIAI